MNELNIIEKLFTEAEKAYNENEIPVAAAIVDKNKNIISIKHNNRQSSNNVLGHAEILSIIDAESKLGDWRLDGYDLYVSLVPCHMCIEIIKECRIDHIYYICDGKNSNLLNEKFIKIDSYINFENKFNVLLTNFFNNMR